MKFQPEQPPRTFQVGGVEMSDCGRLELDPDEQVTLTFPGGKEYDVARKAWGFYATPSLNGRLAGFGWRTALARHRRTGRRYVMLVAEEELDSFLSYLEEQDMEVEEWLHERE